MKITQVTANNITTLGKCSFAPAAGLTIINGEGGAGKTTVLKLIYSAYLVARQGITFAEALIDTFQPNEEGLSRLVSKNARGTKAGVKVVSDSAQIETEFTIRAMNNSVQTDRRTDWERKTAKESVIFIPTWGVWPDGRGFQSSEVFDMAFRIHLTKRDPQGAFKTAIPSAIQQALDGARATIERRRTYLRRDKNKIDASLMTPSEQKLVMLYLLVQRGALRDGAVLLWDTPEACIDEGKWPDVAYVLKLLVKNNVQVMVATNNAAFIQELRDIDDAAIVTMTKERNAAGWYQTTAKSMPLVDYFRIM